MSEQAFVVIGGGVMQIPVVQTAVDMGLKVCVVDKNPQAPAITDDVRAIIADISQPKEVIAALEKSTLSFCGVITAGTDFPETQAAISEHFKLAGISSETANKARHKGRMRECFAEHHIPQPAFTLLNSADQKLSQELHFPLVVKPVDSMGARGVVKVENDNELKKAIDEALKYTRSGEVIVEQFIDGHEFSLDALIVEGEIHIRGIADRIIEFPPYFVETGHIIPSQRPLPEQFKVVDVFKQAIKALGIHNGAAKGDIRFCEGEAYIGEVAARLSGGYMSGFTYPLSSGLNLLKAAIEIQLGKKPEDLLEKQNRIACEMAFLPPFGKIAEINEISALPDYVYRLQYYKQVGESLEKPKNNLDKAGSFIISADSIDELHERIDFIRSRYTPKVLVGTAV